MGNLINAIPVNKPQQQPVTVAKPSFAPIANKYPQDKIYSYIPAATISPARTKPAGVTAQPVSGRLVKENIFQSMANTAKSYADYAKYFYKAAFKGEGTDYSVGKINDLSLRLGSLGIAGVLATSKLFPFAKGMEFVGLGTWFASMALWPKVLAVPIKAIYGVDINQKYIDSQGRRKDVFEDNQYRPMDIYRYVDTKGRTLTKEEYEKKYDHDYVYFDKIARKTGVPDNIKNKNEATMNKMAQIATQGRTLWMLTAGVMTPVLSSIAADAAQKPLNNFISAQRYKKQSANLEKLESQIDVLLGQNGNPRVTDISKIYETLNLKISENTQAQFESLLSTTGEMTEAQFKKMQEFLAGRYYGTGLYTAIEAAMNKDTRLGEPFIEAGEKLKQDLINISKEAFNDVLGKLPESKRHFIPKEFWDFNGMSKEAVDTLFEHLYIENTGELGIRQRNALNTIFSSEVIKPFVGLKTKTVKQEVEKDGKKVVEEVQKADVNVIRAIDKIREAVNKRIKDYINSQRRHIVSKNQIESLFKFTELNAQILDKIKQFEKATIQNISESATAISWENLPKAYVKALNFTKEELAVLATADASTASNILSKKLEVLVQNTEQYGKVLETMSELAKTAITKDEKAVVQLIGTVENPGILFKAKELMKSVAKANFGGNMEYALQVQYLNRIAAVQRKLRNSTDSFIRPIKALDAFKHIESITEYVLGNAEQFEQRKNDINYYMFKNMTYEEAKESFKAYFKDILLQKNDINNWTTKMEVELPNGQRGLKYSKAVLCSMADQVFGTLHDDTVNIIKGNNPEKLAENEKFINQIHTNNKVMKARFLRIENPLIPYMTEKGNFGGLIEQLRNKNTAPEAAKALSEILQDRLADLGSRVAVGNNTLTFEKIKNYQKILNAFKDGSAFRNGYNVNDAINCLKEDGAFQFNSSMRAISEMTGKNITDFFSSAAQSIRSRNKWTKLVYGLLGGALAVSTLTIASMGKKNYFNKDIYELKETSQGKVK